jgi:hypothetical protein
MSTRPSSFEPMSPGGLDVVAEFEIRRPGPDVLLQSLQCQAEIRHDREERNKWLKWGTATGNSSIRDGLNQWYRGRSDD